MRQIVPPITEARCRPCGVVYRCTLTLNPLRHATPRCKRCHEPLRWDLPVRVGVTVPRALPEWVS